MNDIKLTIKAIAAQRNCNLETLAKDCGISYNHLRQISGGFVKMKAEDLEKISIATGIPMQNIQTDYSK